MDVRQRRQFCEALLDADAFEDLPGSRRPQSWLNFAFRDCDTRGVGTSMTPRVLDSHERRHLRGDAWRYRTYQTGLSRSCACDRPAKSALRMSMFGPDGRSAPAREVLT